MVTGRLSTTPEADSASTEESELTDYIWHVKLACRKFTVHTQRNRYAVLFSADVDLEPQRLYRYYKARFQIELLFRDAQQFAGLSDCQARAKAKLDFHFNASLSAVTFAKLEARQKNANCAQACSMASLKRRAFNQHLIDRICEHLANGQSLEKFSPDYETLCNYGIIADEAAYILPEVLINLRCGISSTLILDSRVLCDQ